MGSQQFRNVRIELMIVLPTAITKLWIWLIA